MDFHSGPDVLDPAADLRRTLGELTAKVGTLVGQLYANPGVGVVAYGPTAAGALYAVQDALKSAREVLR